jgi:hypothetical protein
MRYALRGAALALLLLATTLAGCGQPPDTTPVQATIKDGPKGVVGGKRGLTVPAPPPPPPTTRP